MKRIEVERVTRSCTYVRGYGSRDLVVEVTGRQPVWARTDRAWVVQPHRVPDLIAMAEHRGYQVTVLEYGEERLDPGRGRW